MGSSSISADVRLIPGLNTLGISMCRADYAAAGGINRPHLHLCAMEVFFVVDASLEVGFLPVTISKSEVFVFLPSLVHYKRKGVDAPAAVVSAFDSQLLQIGWAGSVILGTGGGVRRACGGVSDGDGGAGGDGRVLGPCIVDY